jgi:methyl coenzyme M reductase beta subunit
VNLSSLGFTFPADTIRVITMHAFIRGNTEHGVIFAQASVLGGTNPVVSESNEIVTHSSGSTALDSAGVAVAINATPTPDEVEVQVTGLSGNPLQWVVHVFVGPAVAIPAAAS